MYESDLTRFMRDFLQQHPEVAEKQKRARASWWDKKLDSEDLQRWEEAKEPVPGYQYYGKP